VWNPPRLRVAGRALGFPPLISRTGKPGDGAGFLGLLRISLEALVRSQGNVLLRGCRSGSIRTLESDSEKPIYFPCNNTSIDNSLLNSAILQFFLDSLNFSVKCQVNDFIKDKEFLVPYPRKDLPEKL